MPRMRFTDRISARTFGLRSDKTVLGFAPTHTPVCPHARIAPIDPLHTFDVMAFEAMRAWWEWTDTRAPLYVSGPAGCGKTSTVLQFLARVRHPSLSLTCRARMDKTDLIGRWGAQGDRFAWFDGPALLAWRHGLTLVLNEMTVAPAAVWVSLNDLFEGAPIVVEATGEVVPRHPNARIVITDNCPLGGTASLRYRDRQRQDASTLDRCWHVVLGYLPALEERELLIKATRLEGAAFDADTHVALCDAAVTFATATRRAPTDAKSAPVAPVSTRVLVRFTALLLTLVATARLHADVFAHAGIHPVDTAIDLSLAAGLDAIAQTALKQQARFALDRVVTPILRPDAP